MTSTSGAGGSRREERPEHRAIGRLAVLVTNVVDQLEKPDNVPPPDVVAECNAALEGYLEAQRDAERDRSVAGTAGDLKRLVRLLTMVEQADAVLVMRQIRRVLGRFDACV